MKKRLKEEEPIPIALNHKEAHFLIGAEEELRKNPLTFDQSDDFQKMAFLRQTLVNFIK